MSAEERGHGSFYIGKWSGQVTLSRDSRMEEAKAEALWSRSVPGRGNKCCPGADDACFRNSKRVSVDGKGE